MTAFPDFSDIPAPRRAALAYHIATGRTLDDRAMAVAWASIHADPLGPVPSHRRAVEAMIPWLDSLPPDDDTRSRLGLEPDGPAWHREHGQALLRLRRDDGEHVADVDTDGWWAYRPGEVRPFATGLQTGEDGCLRAEAALRRAGVLPEGVTVRRAVTP